MIDIGLNINITLDTWDNIKTKEDLCGTIGGWIFYKPENFWRKDRTSKDRYKTLITKIST